MEFKEKYRKRNLTVGILSVLVILLSGFLGYYSSKVMLEPYLKILLKDAMVINAESYIVVDGKVVTSYESEKIELEKNDYDFIRWVFVLICVFVGCVVASILSFFKSNNIDGIMGELGPKAKQAIMKEIQEDLESKNSKK